MDETAISPGCFGEPATRHTLSLIREACGGDVVTSISNRTLLIALAVVLVVVLVVGFWPFLAALIRLACYGI